MKSRGELKAQRRDRSHGCWGWQDGGIVVAMPWPLHGVNAGTLLRTCEAAGACFAIPRYPWVPPALNKGYTIAQRACVHWIRGNAVDWLAREKDRIPDGASLRTWLLGVELADEAIRLADLTPQKRRMMMILGHEQDGIHPGAVELLDAAVEIPMIGCGTSLNVAVAGSLVLYKLAGLI